MLERLVFDASRLVHESLVEKFRLDFLFDVHLVDRELAVVNGVARAALKNEAEVESRESAKVLRTALSKFYEKLKLFWLMFE